VSRPVAPMSHGSVFAPVHVTSFSSAQFDACAQFLVQRASDTESVPIVDERQLMLTAEGRIVENGYRFNAVGFLAVCNALITGLSSVFNDLSGETRNRFSESIANGDFAAAVTIYNTALRSRFELLQGRTLLVNRRDKTVDGFLGIEHRMLDNSVFINLVNDELRNRQPDAEFYRAEIIGRELRLYYVHPKTRRHDLYHDPRHVFAAGWFFSNREDSGLAIRAAQTVLTKFGPAVEPRKRTTAVRHVGADLIGRTMTMVSKVSADYISAETLASSVSRLQAMSMNFSDSKQSFETAMNHWTAYLSRFKIAGNVARQVCRMAAFSGADLDPQNPVDAYSKETIAGRTMYDLFCALLKNSRSQYHTVKDAMQGAAFQMLIPKK
jgi:hypothetical protein